MKWVIIITSIPVVLILIIVLIGLLLPKAHRATHMARFNQPPQVVFALITGPQDWRGVAKTDLPSENGLPRWREQKGRDAITFEQLASDPPRLFRTRIADKNLPFGGTWTWELAATDAGCTCRITEDGEVYNPIFRFVSQFIMGHTKTIDDYLNAMGKKLESRVTIEP